MALFKKLFGKSSSEKKSRGFESIEIKSIEKLTKDTVKVEFNIPEEKARNFKFKPGQYINLMLEIDGKEQRRSYSICSNADAPLAVAVKKVDKGLVSTYLNEEAKPGMSIQVSRPQGTFTRTDDAKKVVAIAAGSGITPIMSIAHDIEGDNSQLNLFYGNRTEEDIIFKNEIDVLSKTTAHFYLSGEIKDGFGQGRLDKENFTQEIKNNLDLLKSDVFFICGPEKMIMDVSDTLTQFGVSEDKIRFELFTDPVLMKPKVQEGSDFKGKSSATVILDGDEIKFELKENEIILEASIEHGFDAPFSCKGGVCSTCKARVLEGKADMKLNYSLTDGEVEEGYILTCQARAASPEIKVSYDEA